MKTKKITNLDIYKSIRKKAAPPTKIIESKVDKQRKRCNYVMFVGSLKETDFYP